MRNEVQSFYDYRPLMSRNGTFNFVTGGRGIGKTYGAKKMAIKHYLERGDQFIYLRRYRSELKSVNTFFADIAHEFPGVEMRVHGNVAERKVGNKWHTMGYFMSLSTASTQKSVAYPDVKLVIFDEFIILKGAIHYLPNEVNAFQELYSTVDRWKDKTRALFLANAVSIMNPYFLEYNITTGSEWFKASNGFIVAHFPQSAAFATEAYSTNFGKFIKGTEYADYSLGSVFHDEKMELIGEKTPAARYLYTIETMSGTFSIWADFVTYPSTIWFCQEKRPKSETILTTIPQAMAEGKQLVTYGDKLLASMRSAYARGAMRFDNPRTRNAFAGIFKR